MLVISDESVDPLPHLLIGKGGSVIVPALDIIIYMWAPLVSKICIELAYQRLQNFRKLFNQSYNQTSRYQRPARFVPSRVNWKLILLGLYIECSLGVITVMIGKHLFITEFFPLV